ncbi:enoyl-CoA hydratase/isomerase family protein [Paracoccaceae bacterium]|nr:enoyl-CoA hydratase/isomerase family protein [Paracoccaceae bacterium]
MSKDIFIRKSGYIGHITLNRPDVLNSLTYSMILAIEKSLNEWETDESIALVIIDAKGDRAFCAGGDIQILYENGFKKNFSYGQKFWADEYRLNEKIANYKKPFIAFMQGFTMGGGVGVSCHGSHRIVGETSKIAMPECSIGLVPDVGGSFLLAKLPGNIGTFLGTTGKRMNASDAIYCGFADYFVPEKKWEDLKEKLVETGNVDWIEKFQESAQTSEIENSFSQISEAMVDISSKNIELRLKHPFFEKDLSALRFNSPISVAYTIMMLKMEKVRNNISDALDAEYSFTARSQEFGDFQEGIRAAVIDKDRNPSWKHKSLTEVSEEDLQPFFQTIHR